MKKIALYIALACATAMPALAENAAAPVYTDITAIVTALIGLLGAVITALLAPYLKAKLGAQRYQSAVDVARTLVKAAEQIYLGPGRGQEKLEYVKTELQKRGITYDAAQIEAAVYELGQTLWPEESGEGTKS